MTVETEVAALTTAVNSLTSSVNVSKATLDESVAAAAAIYDSFDDRYLGAKSSAPSTDNDGNSLLTGALYFNSTENAMYVYTGASWVITTNYNNVTAPYTLAQTLNTNGNDVTFGDNGYATFGAGDDLQIYHDGSNSYVRDTGTGNLNISADQLQILNAANSEIKAGFTTDGAVDLYHNNALKLATTATGIDVTGTATMDGLVVDGTLAAPPIMRINNTGGSWVAGDETGRLQFYTTDGSGLGEREVASIRATKNSAGSVTCDGTLEFWTSPYNNIAKKSMKIDGDTGDISFYEDTGTTSKMVWSASAESLGIGTSSIVNSLGWGSVVQVGGANPALSLKNTGGSQWDISNFGGNFNIYNGSTARFKIDSAGKVGIGTSSPDTLLELVGADPILTIRDTETSGAATNATLRLAESGGSDTLNNYWDINHTANSALSFKSQIGSTASEAMRIDSAGLVSIKNETAPTLRLENLDQSLSAEQVVGALEFFSNDPSGKGPNVVGYIETRAADAVGAGGNMVFATGAIGSTPEGERAIERMRIDSAGNVGIGTDSPDTLLEVVGADPILTIRDTETAGASTNATLRLAESGAAGSLNDYWDINYTGGGALAFKTKYGATNTERMRIDSEGHAIIPNGVTLGTDVGVYDAAKTLDDYEEGTWIPTISVGTHTYSQQEGKYTKIGNQVTVWARMIVTSRGSSGSELGIAGLPFASAGSPYASTFGMSNTYGAAGLLPAAVTPTGGSMEGNIAYLRNQHAVNNSYSIDQTNTSGGLTMAFTYRTA